MSFFSPLSSSAPKKWIKQEKKRLQLEINSAVLLLKQHAALRKKVGLMQPDYFKEEQTTQHSIEKNNSSDSWGLKLAFPCEIPKKRGRPRKIDAGATQTRIVFYKNQSS